MKNIRYFILLLPMIIILGCGKETQTTTQGGGLFKLRVKIDPPLKHNTDPTSVNVNQLGVFISSGLDQFVWHSNGTNVDLSSWESQEIAVTKGQNLPVTITLSTLLDLECKQLKIEAFIDNKIFKTATLELGQTSIIPPRPCKDNGYSNSIINFIIP